MVQWWYLLTVQTKSAKLRNPKSGKRRWVPHSNSSREIRMAWRLDENHGEVSLPTHDRSMGPMVYLTSVKESVDDPTG